MKYYKSVNKGFIDIIYREDNGKYSMFLPPGFMGGKKISGAWVDIYESDMPRNYIHEITEQEAFIEIL